MVFSSIGGPLFKPYFLASMKVQEIFKDIQFEMCTFFGTERRLALFPKAKIPRHLIDSSSILLS